MRVLQRIVVVGIILGVIGSLGLRGIMASVGNQSPSAPVLKYLSQATVDPRIICGDGICEGMEDLNNCPADCGVVVPVCGDGICATGEDPQNCAEDCGNTGGLVISDITVGDITASTATITWTTNLPSSGVVEYGLMRPSDSISNFIYAVATSPDENFVTSHRVTLTELADDKIYHFRVRSRDIDDNPAVSALEQFSSLPALAKPGTSDGTCDSWEKVLFTGPGENAYTIAGVSMKNPLTGWAVGTSPWTAYHGAGGLTNDGGSTWDMRYSSFKAQNFNSVDFIDDTHGIIVGGGRDGRGGSVFMTEDGGATWRDIVDSFPMPLKDVFSINANNIIAVGDKGTIVTSSNGGGSWGLQTLPYGENLDGIWFSDPSNGVIVGGGRILLSTDGGNNWTEVRNENDRFNSFFLDVHFVDSNNGLAVGIINSGFQNHAFRTMDGGKTWIPIYMGKEGKFWNDVFMLDSMNAVAVAVDGYIARTMDNGLSWNITDMHDWISGVWFANPTTGIVGGEGGVYRYIPGTVGYPRPSSSLISLATTHTSTILRWDPQLGASSYRIHRSLTSDQRGWTFNISGDLPSQSTSWEDKSLQCETTYWYWVDVVNACGVARTAVATPVTTSVCVPFPPADLLATASSFTGIDLKWATKDYRQVGFKIERGTDGVNFSEIKTVGADVTSYRDTNLQRGIKYYYRIRAYNNSGDSEYSNVASDRTDVPLGPSHLEVTVLSTNQIELFWRDNSDNEHGFKIERGTDGVNFSEIKTVGADVTSYRDTDLQGGIRYYYRIQAYNNVGNSGYSDVVDGPTGIWDVVSSSTINHLYGVSFASHLIGNVVGGAGTILRTTDGGRTWTSQKQTLSVLSLKDVSFIDGQNGLVVGNDGKILRTYDGGTTWLPSYIRNSRQFYGVHFMDTSTATTSGQSGLILRTNDGGNNWITQMDTGGVNDSVYAVSFTDNNNGTAVGGFLQSRIYRTTDGGDNWAPQTVPEAVKNREFYDVAQIDINTAVAVGQGGSILRTTDGGTTWVQQTSGTEVQLNGVFFYDTNHGVVVGNNGFILRTIDGGQRWVSDTSNTTQNLNEVYLSKDMGVVVGDGGTILLYSSPVNIPKPDLTITELTVSQSNPRQYEPITIKARTKNQGTQASGDNASIRLEFFHVPTGRRLVIPPDQNIPSLGVGVSYEVIWSWAPPLPGEYQGSAQVDIGTAPNISCMGQDKGDVEELDETNNCVPLSQRVLVQPAPVKVDLIITSLRTRSEVSIGEVVNIRADVRNIGGIAMDQGGNVRLQIQNEITGEIKTILPDQSIPALSSGGESFVIWSQNFEKDGFYKLLAKADIGTAGTINCQDGQGGAIEEFSEVNNCSQAVSFEVSPAPAVPNLVVTAITFDPLPIGPGPVRVKATVKNIGGSSSGRITQGRLKIEGYGLASGFNPPDQDISILNPTEEIELTWDGWVADYQIYTVRVKADAGVSGEVSCLSGEEGNIPEYNEVDNCRQEDVMVE